MVSRHGLAVSLSILGLVFNNGLIVAQAQRLVAHHHGTPHSATVIRPQVSRNLSHVDLTLGKAQVVRLDSPATRVSISNPATVSVVVISPTEVELIGKAIGSANLLVWGARSGRNFLTIDLNVQRDVSSLARRIKAIDPGINILPVAAENSVILTGVAESNEKAQLAYDLTKAYFSVPAAAGGGTGALPAIGAPAGGQGSAVTSSDSRGSNTFAQTSTQIINLIQVQGQPSTKAESVQAQLFQIDPHIKLNIVPGYQGNEKAILTGTVRNASMVSKAVNLVSIFYGVPGIKVLTGPGGNLLNPIKLPDDNTQFTAGNGSGFVTNSPNNVLHGSVISDTSGNVISMLEIEERPQVRCLVKVLEVQKSEAKNFGSALAILGDSTRFSTYAGAAGATTANGIFGQVSGNNASELGILYGRDVASYISGLVTSGKARVLAEPTITANSGEPASFLAGGEFPVPTANVNGQTTVTFKQFGIQLNILPTVTDHGTIHMQITPEVSTLDPSAGVTVTGFNIPGLRTRRSKTVLEMRDGQNFVLSGLYNDNMTDVLNKTPLLGDIPVLGALFRSKAYQRQETEMIIVIQPEILSTMNLSNLPPYNTSATAAAAPSAPSSSSNTTVSSLPSATAIPTTPLDPDALLQPTTANK